MSAISYLLNIFWSLIGRRVSNTRVNVYAEEMTDKVEIVEKVIDGVIFTGVRLYLYLPVTQNKVIDGGPNRPSVGQTVQISGPFIHGEGDDDSSAITFWGKSDLRDLLVKALDMLNAHYGHMRKL